MRMLLLISLFAISGCSILPVRTPSITTTRTAYKNGLVTERTETVIKAPKYALEGSYLYAGTNGIEAALSGSQDAKGIIGADGTNKNMRIGYIACGIIFILGIVAFAAPNALISNKDALIISGIGLGGFAAMRWFEASAGIMSVVLPIVAVGGGLYLAWLWLKRRNVA